MVNLEVGLNKIRDLITSDLSTLELGTDGTEATESQTGLVSPVPDTEKAITIEKGNKYFSITYVLYSTEGNGNTYQEMGSKFTDGTFLDRSTFYQIVKDDTFELHIKKRWSIVNG